MAPYPLQPHRQRLGVEYIGNHYDHQLLDALKEHYYITENWEGYLYAGINLKW